MRPFAILSLSLMSLAAAAAAAATAATAAETLARVVQTFGKVGTAVGPLTIGSALQPGARVVSGDNGKIILRMRDDALIQLTGRSDVGINGLAEYALNDGTVRIVSGTLGRANRDKVMLRTPFGDVLATGADYVAATCAVDCPAGPGLYLCVNGGEVTPPLSGGSALKAGQSSYSASAQAAPTVTNTCPDFVTVVATGPLNLRLDAEAPGLERIRQESQDFLNGVLDPAASPSLPVANNAR